MNNTMISYESHLITTHIRPGFYIYILERSFCLILYNIAMIQHYSRCVIRQLLWLRLTYPTTWLRLGFYMWSLQELSANWLLPRAADRSVPGARETYYTRIPWQRTTSHPTRALRYRGVIMYIVFPRILYSTECHICAQGQILCISPNCLQAGHCDAPHPHFGRPKITFDRISRHFRSIRTYLLLFLFTKWLPVAILFLFVHKMAAGNPSGLMDYIQCGWIEEQQSFVCQSVFPSFFGHLDWFWLQQD